MVGIYHPGSETLSDYGASDSADLQLVDGLHEAGNPGTARRGDYFASAGAAWNCAANQARQSNHCGDHQHPCDGIGDSSGADQNQRLLQGYKRECGAVDSEGALATDPQRRLQGFSQWQDDGKYSPADIADRLTALFRFIDAGLPVEEAALPSGPTLPVSPIDRSWQ